MTTEDVQLVQLTALPVLCIRATIPVAQLGDVMGERMSTLSQFLRERGVRPAGPPYVRYHTFGDTETDMETGVPVPSPTAGFGEIVGLSLPEGPAVTTWHLGPHDRLGEAYGRIATWSKDNDREPAGPPWEVYHWIDLAVTAETATASDQSAWRVQLVQPIA